MSERVQIIAREGRPEYAVVPYDEYRRLVSVAERATELDAYDAARASIGAEEEVPGEIVDRLLAGEQPVRVWREFRALDRRTLAQQVEISPSYLAHIEAGRKEGTVAVVRRLAAALDVPVDLLVGWRE